MSIKVLVADDSITIQKVIGIIFGGDEYSLTVVDNGRTAVDTARQINPDILLIDVLMPGMNGYEVAEAVRATPALADKPILLLTGSFEPFDEEKAKKSGADDFIAKPFESQQIISKVKELLERERPGGVATPVPPPIQQDHFFEPVAETAAPILEIPPPVFEAPPELELPELPPAAPADIWSAFTPEVDQPRTEAVTPPVTDSAQMSAEIDVFAIVSEEEDARLVHAVEPAATLPTHTGSQWVPVEENTFEFAEEEEVEEAPPSTFSEQTAPVQEASFGDIAFTEEVIPPVSPEFSEEETTFADFSAPAPAAHFEPLADPVPVFSEPEPIALSPASPTGALTEEQLRVAIAGVSKEIIEKIVWEVVPDLAEALIREAIRKIKEGV
jgi:CheY-like chemotaxis protein